jgi:hypothetical protein
MRAEEFDTLTEKELQEKANNCFVQAENTNVNLTGGHFDELRLHLEAQFYLTAVSKKRDDRVARRDFWMEVGVIILIGAEIILSIVFGTVGILEGKGQMKTLEHMDTSAAATATAMTTVSSTLKSLETDQAESLDRLTQMNTTLNDSLKTSGKMVGAASKQLDILQQEQAERAAQLAKKPQLQLAIGNLFVPAVFNAVHPPSFQVREQTDTTMTFDASILNAGNAAATRVQFRVVLLASDVSFSPLNAIQTPEPPESPSKTYIINIDIIRPSIKIPMTMTFTFPKGHAPFQVVFNVDADEIQTATPLGMVLLAPRTPVN